MRLKQWVIEGFAVDANGVAKDLDFHFAALTIGGMIGGKVVDKAVMKASFGVGWGTFEGKLPQAGMFYRYDKINNVEALGKVKWEGEKTNYDVTCEINSNGSWVWTHGLGKGGSPLRVEGIDNEIKK